MVIYGLLNSNPSDSVQYIRISKAFLGEGNALIFARQKDSINYPDILDVKLQRIQNGAVVQTYSLQRDTTISKNSGLFYSPYQVLYKLNRSQIPLKASNQYKLTVHNNQTGISATSETIIVDSIINSRPSQSPLLINFNFTSPIYYTAEFYPAANAYVYNITIRFHYKEVNLTTHDTLSKYVDWNLGDLITNEFRIQFVNIYRPDLYRIVGSSVVPADTNTIRRMFDSPPIEFVFTAGTEDLYIYQQLVQPSYGLIQERPLFTNVENGVGLLTSRYMKSLFYNLDGISRAAFDTSRYTRNLYFH